MNQRTLRTALSVALILMYIGGLLALVLGRSELGVNLWVISLVGSLGLLYWNHVMKRRAEEAERIAKGMPYGEPDDPDAPVTPVAPTEDEA